MTRSFLHLWILSPSGTVLVTTTWLSTLLLRMLIASPGGHQLALSYWATSGGALQGALTTQNAVRDNGNDLLCAVVLDSLCGLTT